MRQVVLILLIAALGWYGYGRYQERERRVDSPPARTDAVSKPLENSVRRQQFENLRCDGRTTCSQMTSCAEATFFLKNCPGTQMDGNNDGVPCELQWCK
jgi:hypothetical protein